ncbi:unnamed protein product [Commensalibacter communis]|uniref:Uncharacterized protein n=1 Tax=Commensalibacter communis TaxID=2972786 RepID=A0A9W4XIV1_9PROT|nr:DUF6587 family protein [Commensalibacter communis]CAI3942168.1 unnamed protein product [Commensalibacter communis]CAI3944126.1 unnamed protein product [Commensalibacter communis]CAI3958688.1 unnamed protein product [Commensalibacter communis]CAI3959842.1 unnamed protein product [Commensalibacter communis]CAI3959944.1 unnamed protein product [Commensalibacter communis]
MQTIIVVFIVSLCVLFWINRFFPKVGKTLWQGLANMLKLIHAPTVTQQWALKHCAPSKSGCSSCDKCSKCH